jgi:hypothetical protein
VRAGIKPAPTTDQKHALSGWAQVRKNHGNGVTHTEW